MTRKTQGWGSNFDHLADQVWSMMKEMESANLFRVRPSTDWCPSLNLYETRTCFLVCVELAGIEPGKIDVNAQGSTLVISGKRDRPSLPNDAGRISVHLMEIDSGSFRREVSFPSAVDVDRITADYREGYLWVTLPKAGADQPPDQP